MTTSFRKNPQQSSPSPSPTTGRKRKRRLDSSPDDLAEAAEVAAQELFDQNANPKHPSAFPTSPPRVDALGQQEMIQSRNHHLHIHHWAQQGHFWPPEYFKRVKNMSNMLVRKESILPVDRCGDIGGVSAGVGEHAAVTNGRYELLLEQAGIFLDEAESRYRISDAGKELCQTVLGMEQPIPANSLFEDDLFESTCRAIRNRNEARVRQDIARLIVPSPEELHHRGAKHLKHLIETVDERWIKSIPLVDGTQPQPCFAVGLKAGAFSLAQLEKLEPFIGDWQDRSRIMAVDEMYFPFLTSEVICGDSSLDTADLRNAHNASVAANGVVALYRMVSRQEELHREILAFSVSHDPSSVRIYYHYALIDGGNTKFYRHLVREFGLRNRDGVDKWTAYKFTRNLYDTFFPLHLRRIVAVIDQLPAPASTPAQARSEAPNGLWAGESRSPSSGSE